MTRTWIWPYFSRIGSMFYRQLVWWIVRFWLSGLFSVTTTSTYVLACQKRKNAWTTMTIGIQTLRGSQWKSTLPGIKMNISCRFWRNIAAKHLAVVQILVWRERECWQADQCSRGEIERGFWNFDIDDHNCIPFCGCKHLRWDIWELAYLIQMLQTRNILIPNVHPSSFPVCFWA